jgi:transposase-like protein
VDEATAIMALRLIVEGNSIRSASRLTRLHRDTIMKLIVSAGEKCEALLSTLVKNVPVRDVQAR